MVYAYVSGHWPNWWRSPIGQWAGSLAARCSSRSVDTGENITHGLTNCFVKLLNWNAHILSFVQQKQLIFLYDIDNGLFISGTKIFSEIMIDYWVNRSNFSKNKQGLSHCFQLHARAPPVKVSGWVDERIHSIQVFMIKALRLYIYTTIWGNDQFSRNSLLIWIQMLSTRLNWNSEILNFNFMKP